MPESNYYSAFLTGTPFTNDTIKVIYDGVEYEASNYSENEDAFSYGAEWVEEPYTIDFSEYPFLIISVPVDEEIDIYIEDDTASEEHTVQILGETSGTPAVWKKVGSGGSSPEPQDEDNIIIIYSNVTQDLSKAGGLKFSDTQMSSTEIGEAIDDGKNVFLLLAGMLNGICYFTNWLSSDECRYDSPVLPYNKYISIDSNKSVSLVGDISKGEQ